MNPSPNLKIVFLGAGAIGGSVGAWVAQRHANTYLLARGATADALSARGMTLYPGSRPDQPEHIPVQVIRGLDETPDADVVVIGVKLYDLERAAQQIKDTLDNRALVLSLQNGVAAQEILPGYFSRCLFGVVAYNAWMDAPGVIGYGTRGPILLGTLDDRLQPELHTLADLFNQSVETLISPDIRNMAYNKLVVNLTNSVTTLLGLDFRKISDLDHYQDILAHTLFEGVQIIRAAGFHEDRQGGLLPWNLYWALAKLPHFLTRRTFQRNLSRMTLSSMGQDVFQRQRSQTELEYLNGTLLQLADQHHLKAQYNRAIYRLCQQHFAQPDFQPLDVSVVWTEIQRKAEQ